MADVVIAEDDPVLAEVVRRYVADEGHRVRVVDNGRSALEAIRASLPDALILDVMMPLVDGFDVVRIVRAENAQIGILMVTARKTENDVLLGLDLGADDYLVKPVSPRELMGRLRALLRRIEAQKIRATLRANSLTIDSLRREVLLDGRRIECTPGEFAVLQMLAEHPGRVFERKQLLRRVKGAEGYVTPRTIDTHVAHLRRKLEEDPSNPQHVLTVHGVGYRLADPS